MTIMEALRVLAVCDTEKDDCGTCPLNRDYHFRDEEGGSVNLPVCILIGRCRDALAPLPFPGWMKASAQG